MATMTPDKYGYRKYLNEKGYKDDEITYDNGNIYVQGRYFDSATPEADGSTYNSRANLDRTFGNFTRQNNMEQRQNTSNELLKAYQNRLMTQQPKTFEYKANRDPLYKNALESATKQAGLLSDNTMARLRATGRGNSSWSEGLAHQTMQNAVENVNSNILPQLMDQAYRRFVDQQNMERQQAGDMLNLAGVLSNLNQQDFANNQTLENAALARMNADRNFGLQNKQANQAVAQWYSQNYGVPIDPKEDWGLLAEQVRGLTPLNVQQFNAQNEMNNAELALRRESQAAQLANMRADNARAAGNNQLAQLYEVWDRTGVAPAGIPGVEPGTPLYDRTANRVQEPSQTDIKNETEARIYAMTDEGRKRLFTDPEDSQELIKILGRERYDKLKQQYRIINPK